ncbi:hypothetical protein ACF1DV_26095 [Streptomyces achromogenes]|uniref:hypothetical protein n=1 Tax=Streptomyces achromogenes TaxID=67255 RepID=UPI0036F5C7CB
MTETKIQSGAVELAVDVDPDKLVHLATTVGDQTTGAHLPPAKARELAAALLRAADEAEGREPMDVQHGTSKNGDLT